VVEERARWLHPKAESTLLQLTRAEFAEEARFLRRRCEPYRYVMHKARLRCDQREKLVSEDKGAVGLSAVLRAARPRGGLVYLSGSGADEIISDYAMNGIKLFAHSCFGGTFPSNLSAGGILCPKQGRMVRPGALIRTVGEKLTIARNLAPRFHPRESRTLG